MEAVERGEIDRLMINMPPRHGKLCAHSTPVLTTNGWKLHGELAIGDFVFGPDGQPTPVIAVSADDVAACEVGLSNGDTIKCHEQHEWTIYDRTRATWRTVETAWFMSASGRGTRTGKPRQLTSGPVGKRGGRYLFQLPDVAPVEFADAALPMDPYVLGVWLGDGTSVGPKVTMADADAAVVIPAVEAAGYVVSAKWTHASTGVPTYSFGGPGPNIAGRMHSELKALGLLRNKHIPDAFKFSSVEQRCRLLAGLIDTDGHVDTGTGRVRIVTGSEGLARDIVDVATGLGFRPYVTTNDPVTSTSGIVGRRVVHVVAFQPTMRLPTRLDRKQIRKIAQRRRVSVVSVRRAETAEPGRCVQVARPDGLYLVGRNLTPTHNSELASRRFPAWFLGRHPNKSVIAASYNSDLAADFGRQVRNIVASKEYGNLFQVRLAEDSRAANRWNTSEGGAYVAAGVGTAITGRGADILLIDDPVKDREEADSEIQRQKVWDWYTSTAYTRLAPGGRIIVIQCMTGDTPVLMATGHEKPLRDIRPGDRVATYDRGKLSVSTVRNWANQGPDRVFTIRMKSGITVRANARHPFLVDEGGETKWLRTASIKPGAVILRAIGANGEAPRAQPMGATSPPNARVCVTRTTTKSAGVQGIDRRPSTLSLGVTRICAIATELALLSTSAFLPNRAAFALCAGSPLPARTLARTGTTSFASITATIAKRCAGFSATTATWLSDTGKQSKSCSPPLSTFEIVKDTVVEVVDAGVEDVFDIEVEGTENFIANGLVSHNTRWHEDDLSGRLLVEQSKGGDAWEVLELPAITSDGQALWPEFYPLDVLERTRRVLPARDWSALYQQRPAPDEGAYFKREWFRWYDEKPAHLRIYGASDYAVTDGDGDYTVHVVVGVDPDDNIYVLDLWRGQTASDVWISAWLDLVRAHKPMMWAEEQGQIVKSIGPFLDKRMREERVYCRREQITSASDKPTRSRAIQARTSMGKVYLPSKAPWMAEFTRELLTFPAGKHDDQVDAFGLIGRLLDEMVPAAAPKVEIKRPVDGYRKPEARDSWRTLT